MKPDIIITRKLHAGTQATLDAEFATHKLFEAFTFAFLATFKAGVRAEVCVAEPAG